MNFNLWHKSLKLIKESEISIAAGALAYTTLLSIVPFLALVFAMFQVFGGLENLNAQIENTVLDNLATHTQSSIAPFIRNFIANTHAKTVGFSGLVGLLITNYLLIEQIDRIFHKLWRIPFNRPFVQKIVAYWASMTLLPAIIFSVIIVTKDLPLRGLISSFIAIVLLAALYRIFSQTKSWLPAFFGAFVGVIGLYFGQIGFQLYIRKFVSFEKIYGALGSVPIFLVWVYMNWWLVIFGATLTYLCEQMKWHETWLWKRPKSK